MKSLKWGTRGLGLLIVLQAVLLATNPTATNEEGQRQDTRTRNKMKIYDALKIAVDALEAKKLMYRPEYKLRAAKVEEEWVFWFVFLPETPGMDITVFVSDDGQTRFLPGM